MSITPVSGSISTSATCAPPGKDIRAFHAVPTVGKFHIAGRDFQLPGRELEALLHRRARGGDERAAMRHHRARADRAAADQLRTCRIARAQRDAVGRHAELQRHEIREHRLVPLARRAGEDVERGIARFAELDRRLLGAAGGAARGLDEHRAADAAQLAAPLRFFPPLVEARPVGVLERVVQVSGRIAAVVGRASRRLVGERFFGDEVAPA
jgi:hypothetical protein